jgi:hypothetical protein
MNTHTVTAVHAVIRDVGYIVSALMLVERVDGKAVHPTVNPSANGIMLS